MTFKKVFMCHGGETPITRKQWEERQLDHWGAQQC